MNKFIKYILLTFILIFAISTNITSASSTSLTPISSAPTLKMEDTNPAVLLIQQYLNNHGYIVNKIKGQPGSVGNETNRFGLKTKQALIRFQENNNIIPANGVFGPNTKAKMLELAVNASDSSQGAVLGATTDQSSGSGTLVVNRKVDNSIVTESDNPYGISVVSDPSNAGIDCGSTCSKTYNDAKTMKLIASATSPKVTFVSWSGVTGGETTDSFVMRPNISKFATVTYKTNKQPSSTGNGNGQVQQDSAGTTKDSNGNTQLTFIATPSYGSVFVGFTGCDSVVGKTCKVLADKASSVVANFILAQMSTLTINGNPSSNDVAMYLYKDKNGGESVPLNTPEPYVQGDTINIYASVFDYAKNLAVTPYWTGCDNVTLSGDGSICTVTMVGNKTVAVSDAQNSSASYTLTTNTIPSNNDVAIHLYQDGPTGAPLSQNQSQTYVQGQIANIYASIYDYTKYIAVTPFWAGCDSVTPSGDGSICTVAMNENKITFVSDVAANLPAPTPIPVTPAPPSTLQTYTVSLAKSGTGSGTLSFSDDSGTIGGVTGTSLKLALNKKTYIKATPTSGSTISKWSGCLAITGIDKDTCVINSGMKNARRKITYTFNKIPTYKLTLVKSAGGTVAGMTGTTQSYKVGENVTLKATANSGYVFTAWGDDCSNAIGTSCTLVMNANKKASVKFTKNPPLYLRY